MKQILMTMVALMLTATVNAQPQTGHKPVDMDQAKHVKMRTEQMTKRYDLTDKQAKKVQKLNEKYIGKMRPMKERAHIGEHKECCKAGGEQMGEHKGGCKAGGEHKGGHKPSAEQLEQMKRDHEAYDAELQQILTPEQFQKYQADAKKHFGQGRKHHGKQHHMQRSE